MKTKNLVPACMALFLALALAGCSAAAAPAPPSSQPAVPGPASSAIIASQPSFDEEAPPAITVRYIEGEVVYLRGAEEAPLSMETLLYQGDAVKTGSEGMAVLKLDGDKQVQLAPGTHVEIAGFERGDNGNKTLLYLHAGNLINVLDVPLESSDSYEVETPALVMAIRGTIASVSHEQQTGRAGVLLFEGSSLVTEKSSGDEAALALGGHAWVQDEQLAQGTFAVADLNPNEHWFLFEADYPMLFDEPYARIEDRLEALFEGMEDQEAPALQAAAGAPPAESPAAPQDAPAAPPETEAAPPNSAPPPASTPRPANDDPPPAEDPPAADEGRQSNDPPPANEPAPADEPEPDTGGGMDEATFRAIEQEFLQAKADYNNGLIGKDAFLAVKQRYIEAKQQFYGD